MSVFRVEKNKDYTVMSNYHLRDNKLSLKAKGLLSQMLSLPEDWDYTLSGLCYINKESKDAIRTAINELEQAGYIKRHQTTDISGKFSTNEYVIYECPVLLSETSLEKPLSENPTTEEPTAENPTQINKDIKNKEKKITESFPILSYPFVCTEAAAASVLPKRERKEKAAQDVFKYQEIIKKNIEYEYLIGCFEINKKELDGIVDLLTETVCSTRKTIRIACDDYPAEFVKAKLLKLQSDHIVFVMECIRKNTTNIRNIKNYLLTTLFNAVSTIDSYYTALVSHENYR